MIRALATYARMLITATDGKHGFVAHFAVGIMRIHGVKIVTAWIFRRY